MKLIINYYEVGDYDDNNFAIEGYYFITHKSLWNEYNSSKVALNIFEIMNKMNQIRNLFQYGNFALGLFQSPHT